MWKALILPLAVRDRRWWGARYYCGWVVGIMYAGVMAPTMLWCVVRESAEALLCTRGERWDPAGVKYFPK